MDFRNLSRRLNLLTRSAGQRAAFSSHPVPPASTGRDSWRAAMKLDKWIGDFPIRFQHFWSEARLESATPPGMRTIYPGKMRARRFRAIISARIVNDSIAT
jgi:hypothetical protein